MRLRWPTADTMNWLAEPAKLMQALARTLRGTVPLV
jgi:hypothetical protein